MQAKINYISATKSLSEQAQKEVLATKDSRAPTLNLELPGGGEIVTDEWTQDAMQRTKLPAILRKINGGQLRVAALPVLGNVSSISLVMEMLHTSNSSLYVHDLYGKPAELKEGLLRYSSQLLQSVTEHQPTLEDYHGGQPRFGWRHDGNKLVPDPHEQQVREAVRRLYFRGGLNLKEVTARLELRRGGEGGEPYSYQTVQRIVEGLKKEVGNA